MSWPSSLSLEGFYAAALWLHACHPRTLALNAAPVADFGYLKDLPELLHRIVHGGASTRTPGKKARLAGGGGFVGRCGRGRGGFLCRRGRGGGRFGSRDPRRGANHAHAHAPRTGTTEERVAASLEHDRGLAAAAAAARRTRRAEAAARAVEMYRTDPTYRFLHDRTADLFAGLLAEDMRKLADGKFREFSLATKWCPSLDSSYDRSTLLCEAVARRLFPKGSSLELAADLPDEHYAYRARERLRKAALVPLRHALKLPEVFISARAWESVAYTRVASVAMKNYKDLFLKHDADRFNAYLDDVKSGKKRIATGALLPTTHPICFAPPPAHGSHKWCRATSSSAPARAAGQQHSTAPVCPCARLCCWFGGHSTRWWRKREVRLLLVDLRKGKNRDRRSLLLQRNQRERATDLMQRRKDWPVAAGLPCLGFGARGCSLGKGAVAVEMLQWIWCLPIWRKERG